MAHHDTPTSSATFWTLALSGGLGLPSFIAATFIAAPKSFQGALRGLPDLIEALFFLGLLALSAIFTILLLRLVVKNPKRIGVLASLYFGTAVSLLVLIFSMFYWLNGDSDGSCMETSLTKIDSIYFTLTTLSTTGFGDIKPTTQACRAVVGLQMIYGFVVLTGFFGVFLTRFTERPDR